MPLPAAVAVPMLVGSIVSSAASTTASLVSSAASIASTAVSLLGTVTKAAFKVVSVGAGIIGGTIKLAAHFLRKNRERREAAKLKKQEQTQKMYKEMMEIKKMKQGTVPGFAYQPQSLPSRQSTGDIHSPQNKPVSTQTKSQATKDSNKKDSMLSTVFDKRSDEERKKEGGYVEVVKEENKQESEIGGNLKIKTPTKTSIDLSLKRKSSNVNHSENQKKEIKSGDYSKEKTTPSQRQSLEHNMQEVKADVKRETYAKKREELIKKCNMDLKIIRAEYQEKKKAYARAKQGVRGSIPGSGKISELEMQNLADKFEKRQDRLEKDLILLEKKYL